MKNPGTGIVSDESDGNVIVCLANADYVSLHRVNIVVSVASSASNNMEGMLRRWLVQFNRWYHGAHKTYTVQVHGVLVELRRLRQN